MRTVLSDRPKRRMPTAEAVAGYWYRQYDDDPFAVDFFEPRCFRCNLRLPTWNHFERAHLVNRGMDGTDFECNLAMLCHRCHRRMPNFDAGEGQAAISWVRTSLMS